MNGKVKLDELSNEQLKNLDGYLDIEAIQTSIKEYKKSSWIEIIKMIIAIISSIIALNLGDMIIALDNKTGGVIKYVYWCLLWMVLIAVLYVVIKRISRIKQMFGEIADNNLCIDFIGVEQLFSRFNLEVLGDNYNNAPWCVVVYIGDRKLDDRVALWVKWIDSESDKRLLECIF